MSSAAINTDEKLELGFSAYSFNLSGVESLVGWLLDHPDVQVTELSDADTVSDEYSEEEVLEELEETEPTFPVVHYCFVTMSKFKIMWQ